MLVPKQMFLKTIDQLAGSVYDFHKKFDIPSLDNSFSSKEVAQAAQRRVLLQCEELGELSRAISEIATSDIYEEAADVLYIALGTIAVFSGYGINACNQVIGKNQKKALDSLYIKNQEGKVVKK